MKFIRFESKNGVGYGVLEENDVVRVYQGDMFRGSRPSGETLALSEVQILPPTATGTMIALWNNSRQQIAKLNRETPKEVLWFLKPASSFIGHGADIVYPRGETERVVLEGEIGIVIGKRCRNVSAKEARDCIFGYTIVNDVTAQDVVNRDKTYVQYTRGKAFDTFSVFGPCVATDIDPMTLTIESFLNGEKCQEYPVTDLVFDPYETVADISRTMTMEPGDVIACGTSLGVKPIVPGDTVEIRIDGIGSLVNKVI